MSLNRDSAFLVEDRYVECRYMNHTFAMTTDGVGETCQFWLNMKLRNARHGQLGRDWLIQASSLR